MSHPHRKDAMTASAGKLTTLLGHSKHKAHGSPYGKGSFLKAPKSDGVQDSPLPFHGTTGYAGNGKKPSPRHPKTGGKVPGFARGGRADKFARGGPGKGDKKHGTTVNITVQGGGKSPMTPPPAPPPMPPGGGGANPMAPHPGGGAPPPGGGAPMGGGMPPGMPNMSGVPNMGGINPQAMMKGLGTPLGAMGGGRKQGGRIGYKSGGRCSGIMGESKKHWENYAESGSKTRSGDKGDARKLYARGGTVSSPITGKGGAASGVGRLNEDHYYAKKGKHGINPHNPYGGRS